MLAKYFFFVLGTAAFAQGGETDSDVLRALRDAANGKLRQTLEIINNAPKEFESLIEDRLECLKWEHTVQATATNETISEAIFKGMLKNKQFVNFQCISTNSLDTFEKLNAVTSEIPENSLRIRGKALSGITSFGLIVPGTFEYFEDLYKNKLEQLKKEEKETERKKILNEVTDKVKLLKCILDKFDDYVKTTKFQFFEEFVNYAFKTGNSLKKIQKEGAQKILKCVV